MDLLLHEELLSEMVQANRLVLCGLDHSLAAARDTEYGELIRRYHADPNFNLLCHAAADGLKLRLLEVSRDYGVVVSLKETLRTPFVMDLKSISSSLVEPETRQMFAVVLTAVVTFLFENQAAIEGRKPSRIAVKDLEERLRALADNLSSMPEEEIDETADTAAEMFKVMRKKDVLSRTDGGPERKGRPRKGTLRWTIEKVFDFLEGRGLVVKENEEVGGTYRARQRFVIHTRAFGGDGAFQMVQELTRRKKIRAPRQEPEHA
jgi:hypothetical protein